MLRRSLSFAKASQRTRRPLRFATRWSYPDSWNGYRVNNANSPSDLAGFYIVYLIEHLPSNKCYIGATKNLPGRCAQHHASGHANKAIVELLNTEGRKNFGIMPLYMSIVDDNDKSHIHEIERELIITYDAHTRGFNKLKSELDRPEHMRNVVTKSWNDPERRAARLAKGRSVETRTKKSLANKGRIRITNGTEEKFVEPGTPIPDGWRQGGKSRRRPKNYIPSTAELNARSANKGRVYITNGINNRRIYKHEQIPQGWQRGMTNWTNRA